MPSAVSSTSIAAIEWGDSNGKIHHRVYMQGTDHHIYEYSYDGSGWTSNPRKLDVVAAPSSAIAAIYWDFSSKKNNPQIRLYYLDGDYTIQEYAYNGGWGSAASLPAPDPLPNTKIDAFVWGDYPDIRVFYQKRDLTLQEVVFRREGGWFSGHHFA